MSNQLKVAALPHSIIAANPEANLQAVDSTLQKLPAGTDIIVFPEMFTTAYMRDKELMDSLAERNSGKTMETVARWASEKGAAVSGTFLARDGAEIFNRAFFVEPSGEASFYDKRHLFTPGGEDEIYAQGEKRFKPVRFRGWNIMLLTCYDLRFPAWCRNRRLEYDLAILPANWAEAREYAFTQLLIARAIENQACYIGANRGGSDKFGNYPARMTQVFNWKGEPTGKENGDFITAELDLDAMNRFRTKFPVYRDADDFEINIEATSVSCAKE